MGREEEEEDDDLQLALALSASLALQTASGAQSPPRVVPQQPVAQPPRPRPPPPPPPPPPPAVVDESACTACRRAFSPGSRFLTALGRAWHPQCFVCAACQQPFAEGSFVVQQQGDDDNDGATANAPTPRPYHPHCHRTLFSPICCVCGESVPEKTGGGGGGCEWREHPFWRAEQRFCPKHGRGSPGWDGTPSCSACGRLRPSARRPQADDDWARLSDGRMLCGDCTESVVVDTRDAQPLYAEVLAFLEAALAPAGGGGGSGAAFPYRPPLYLVDGPTMHAHALREGRRSGGGGEEDDDDEDEGGDGSDGAPIFHNRGLCICTVTTTTWAPSIPALPLPGSSLGELFSGLFGGGGGSSSSNSASSARRQQQPQPHRRQSCEVHALLVLDGLPRALAGAVIAHECTHAHLRMRGVGSALSASLPLDVEEGLCQLAALLWLESPAADDDERGWPARLRAYGAHQIRDHVSPVYGGGFRRALDLFQRRGVGPELGGLRLLVDACVAARGWPPSGGGYY